MIVEATTALHDQRWPFPRSQPGGLGGLRLLRRKELTGHILICLFSVTYCDLKLSCNGDNGRKPPSQIFADLNGVQAFAFWSEENNKRPAIVGGWSGGQGTSMQIYYWCPLEKYHSEG